MLTPETLVEPIESFQDILVGKTVLKINETAVNCLEIEFTDGSELRLEAEFIYSGKVPVIQGYVRR